MRLLVNPKENAYATIRAMIQGTRWEPRSMQGGITSYILEVCGYERWPGWTTVCGEVGLEEHWAEFWELENEAYITKEEATARFIALVERVHGKGVSLL